jgi:hypothetical protein
MPHAKRTVHIQRTSAPCRLLRRQREHPPWRGHVKEIQRVGPGMTYRQKIAGPGGRAIAWTSKSPPTNSTQRFQVWSC